MNTLYLAYQFLLREWRAKELTLIIIALAISISCMTSIGLFTDRIQQALTQQASNLLGGNALVTSPNNLPNSWIQHAKTAGLSTTQNLTFLSMLNTANNTMQLASIKAVSDHYPLRGKMKISTQLYTSGEITDNIPAQGTIWLQPRLFELLKVKPGDSITLGASRFTITQVLISEPDSPGNLFALSPRALINLSDVAKTQVVQPGSKINYNLLLAGAPASLGDYQRWLTPQLEPQQKWISPTSNSPTLKRSLDSVNHYLNLGALLSVILAGTAMLVALKRFTHRHFDVVALMRCFGASSRQILGIYFWFLLELGLISLLVGCIASLLLQNLLEQLFAHWLPIDLTAIRWQSLWFGTLTGLLLLLIIGLPPLWQLKSTTPLKILQRDLLPLPKSNLWIYAGGSLLLGVIIFWHLQNITLTIILLASVVITFVVLLAAGWILIQLTQLLRRRVGIAWRYGIANLGRRWQSSLLQMTAFGLTLMVLLLLLLVRNDLLQTWKNQLPADTPNYFAINIFPNQVTAVQKILADAKIPTPQIFPIVRGRLFLINQQPVDSRKDSALQRELNLSWTDHLPMNNELTAGHWWQPADDNVISVEQGLAERLYLKLGDSLSFRIGANTITAKIISFRKLDWTSFQPNFFILFKSGLLENYPATYITSFYFKQKSSNLINVPNQLVEQFPNISLLDVAEIIYQMQNFLAVASNAVSYLLAFALIAGLVLLYASIYSSIDQRLQENAVLRALGASRYQLQTAIVAEFLTLGTLSGLLGGLMANAAGMALSYWLFNLNLNLNLYFDWKLVIQGIIIGGVVITLFGWLTLRRVTRQSPLLILR